MKKNFILLVLILLFAFFLRFYQIENNPPSLNWDEAAIGYNAYSILKTGKDEWGEFLPLHFKSYGEYKLPVQVYGSIPGIYIFGLNELGVRITPVIYGVATVALMYFLAIELWGGMAIGIAAAFLLAISPWHIQLTRASFESSFSVFWIVMGIWFLAKGFKSSKWLIWSMIPFVISIYTYNTARVFTPLFLFVILIIYRKVFLKLKKTILISGFIFFICLLPLIPFYFNSDGNARFKLVSITNEQGLVPRINERRGQSSLPEPLPRLIHNKVTYVSAYFIGNYLAHFTPQFLFLEGAGHKQHHVQDVGELYLFQMPLVLLGIFLLLKKRYAYGGLIFSWLLLSFIPVAITGDSIPHALRTLVAAPVYQFISALGLIFLYQWIKNKLPKIILIISVIIFIFIVAISIQKYLVNFYTIYPVSYSEDWQYGYKQVISYVKSNQNKYDLIVITRHYGEPHMFLLFYLNYSPLKFRTSPNLIRFETHDWIRVLQFDKYRFPDLGDVGTQFKDIISENKDKKILFIGKPGDFPENTEKVFNILFLDGKPGFEGVKYP